jgi:hypothetical protein
MYVSYAYGREKLAGRTKICTMLIEIHKTCQEKFARIAKQTSSPPPPPPPPRQFNVVNSAETTFGNKRISDKGAISCIVEDNIQF